MPNPIDVIFRPVGHTEVLAALKSITDATIAAARAAAAGAAASAAAARTETEAAQGKARARKTGSDAERDAAKAARDASKAAADEEKKAEKAAREKEKAYRDALKAAKDLERGTKDAARAMDEIRRPRQGKDFFGNDIELRAQSKGVEQMSGSKAFNEIFGRTAAQLLGLYGPAGQLVGVFNVLKGAVSLAADALTGFGAFLLRDIVQPQLKLSVSSQQLSNRIGGRASGEQIKGAINGAYAANAHLELGDVESVFTTALDKTKSLNSAQQIAGIVGKASKAYGFDPKQLAEFVSGLRAQNPTLGQNAFENFASNIIASGKDTGGNFNQFLGRIGDIQKASDSLGGFASPDVAAGNTAAISALIAAGAKGGRSAGTVATGLTQLIGNLKQHGSEIGIGTNITAAATSKDLVETLIPMLLTKVGGNLHDPKLLGAQGGALGTKVLDQTSRSFLEAIGADKIYNNTKGTAQDKEAAVRDALRALIGVGDAAKASAGASLLDADAKKTEQTAGYQFDAALREMKVALNGIMPVVTDQLIPAFKQATPAITAVITEIASAVGSADLTGALTGLVKAVSLAAYGMLKAYDWIDRKFLGGQGVGEDAFANIGKLAGIAQYQTVSKIDPKTGKVMSDEEVKAKRAGQAGDEFGSYDENGDYHQTVLQQMAELAKNAKEASKALAEVAGNDPSRKLGFGDPYRVSP